MIPEQDAYRDACLREAHLALGEAIVRERLLVQEVHRLTAALDRAESTDGGSVTGS